MIHEGSGNVFADLGFADPVSHRLKAELVRKLDSIVKSRSLSQSATARLIEVSQPDLSKLLNGRLREMSVERLLRMFTRLGCDVDINVQFEGQAVGEAISSGCRRRLISDLHQTAPSIPSFGRPSAHAPSTRFGSGVVGHSD